MNISRKVLAVLVLAVGLTVAVSLYIDQASVDRWVEADRKLEAAMSMEFEANAKLKEADAKLKEADAKLKEADAKLAQETPEGVAKKMAEADAKLKEAGAKLKEAKDKERKAGAILKAANEKSKAQREAQTAEQRNKISEFTVALIAVASETEEPIARLLQEAKFCLQNHCPDELVEAHLNLLDEVDREAYNQCEFLGQNLEVDHDSIRSICLKFHMSMFGTPSDEIYFALVEQYFP